MKYHKLVRDKIPEIIKLKKLEKQKQRKGEVSKKG